jgi:FkbM family methyltransferase
MRLTSSTSLIAKALKRGRSVLNRHGYDIHPVDSRCWEDQRALLGNHKDTLIFDVGANCGQTAWQYRNLFPNAQIYCFEPQPDLCRELENRFRDDPRISVYACAVGATEGTANFYLNAKRATSSLLAPDVAHLSPSYLPMLRNEEICPVRVITVDSFAASRNLRHIDLLKMDIQGGECEALHGATELLANSAIDLIYSEAFFVPMYANQPLFGDLVSYLAKWNYRLHLIYNQNINGISGRPLQADVVFVSPKLQECSVERLRTSWIS